MDELLALSGTELARRIRSREASAREVVERHIDRIREVNPRLNAVVAKRFEEALHEAAQADDRLARDESEDLPPLLGVPFTVKESVAVEGMPNTSGLLARSGVTADRDATVVARLRAAGAIPLGVTNLPEIASHVATFNRVYGRTSNAYSTRHIAGGSSGGEGAIIGAGGSPFGLGTDVGGSIRGPAFCNGVFGHKPTGGLVPGTGQYPGFRGDLLRKNTTGPLARRAEDLMPLLRILAGPDGCDEGCHATALGDPDAVDLRTLRVVVVENDGTRARVHPELVEAQRRAAESLSASGAAVEWRRIPELRQSGPVYLALVLGTGEMDVERNLGNGAPVSLLREMALLTIGRSAHTHPPLVVAAMARLASRPRSWLERNAERGRALLERLESLLGDDGALLYPSALAPAPRHGLRSALNFRFTAIFNALELPVTQVPLGLGSAGLPLGVQVAAARGRDHLSIRVALELERVLGGWVPPPDA